MRRISQSYNVKSIITSVDSEEAEDNIAEVVVVAVVVVAGAAEEAEEIGQAEEAEEAEEAEVVGSTLVVDPGTLVVVEVAEEVVADTSLVAEVVHLRWNHTSHVGAVSLCSLAQARMGGGSSGYRRSRSARMGIHMWFAGCTYPGGLRGSCLCSGNRRGK
jgi:hypothetical protein